MNLTSNLCYCSWTALLEAEKSVVTMVSREMGSIDAHVSLSEWNLTPKVHVKGLMAFSLDSHRHLWEICKQSMFPSTRDHLTFLDFLPAWSKRTVYGNLASHVPEHNDVECHPPFIGSGDAHLSTEENSERSVTLPEAMWASCDILGFRLRSVWTQNISLPQDPTSGSVSLKGNATHWGSPTHHVSLGERSPGTWLYSKAEVSSE